MAPQVAPRDSLGWCAIPPLLLASAGARTRARPRANVARPLRHHGAARGFPDNRANNEERLGGEPASRPAQTPRRRPLLLPLGASHPSPGPLQKKPGHHGAPPSEFEV